MTALGAVPLGRFRTLSDGGVERDGVLPLVIIGSVLVHICVIATVLVPDWHRPVPEREIPVELVQLPKPPEPPKPPPVKPQDTPQPQKTADAQKSVPKTAMPKPVVPKTADRKAASKNQAPKSQAPEPSAAKAPVAKTPPADRQAAPKPPSETVAQRLKDLLGPIPPALAAVALPGEAEAGTELVSYKRLVLSKVAKAKKEGRYPGEPGAATVAFVLGDAGEVKSVEIKRPSGIASLDEEAIAMIRRGEPYPAPPPGAQRDFAVTLQFRTLP